MDNYVKGEEVDAENSFPFDSELILNVPVLKVKTNTKIHNLCGYAEKLLSNETCRKVLFVGVGSACTKTISCVEVFKRRLKFTLHQLTKTQFKRIEEFWEPIEKGLDRLKVNRDVPVLYILLSKDILNQDDLGYQAPGEFQSPFCEQRQTVMRNQKQRRNSQRQQQRKQDNIWKRPKAKEKSKETNRN